MHSKMVLLWIVLLSIATVTNCFWGDVYIRDFVNSFAKATEDKSEQCEQKDLCDENQLMLHLACIRITSPERILLLLTWDSALSACRSSVSVLDHINDTLTECVPLPPTNLYVRLTRGLSFFYNQICARTNSKSKQILNYHNCITELRDDLIDCEGPPDWFERRNKAYVCSQFNEIINCDYVRAALLCGVKPARLLRSFAAEVLNKVLLFKCPVPSKLPHVDHPMTAVGSQLDTPARVSLLCIFILVFLLHIYMQ